MEKRWITILNYSVGEVNIYEIIGNALKKYYELCQEEFIEEVVGLNSNEVSWMFTSNEPHITNEVLTLK